MKDIKNYESLYAITEFGQVWSYRKQIFLSLQLDKNGYEVCDLRYKGKRKNVKIHRLMAEHYIANINNKSEVNHIDGNKQNNSLNNLEWVTHAENMKHAWDLQLICCEQFRKSNKAG